MACAKNGIIWSSCSPDFGVQGVVDRFKQIEPKVLITSDYYFYNGKKIDILERANEVLEKIPSINEVLVFSYNKKEKLDLDNFKNFDEVIEKANNQVAGLASYVCTNSIDLANRTSEALETGMVAVNTPFISNAETPFGGIKQSGYGREGGSNAIKDYLNVKYTHLGIKG